MPPGLPGDEWFAVCPMPGFLEIRAMPHPLLAARLAGGFSLSFHFLWWAESPQEELERSHQLSGNVPMA